jgi:hypothetical protein
VVSTTDHTAEKQRPAHLFKPGVSGNPRGRPRGSRSKLSETFLSDLAACWQRHGAAALEACATQQPDVLIRTVASLLPRDMRIDLDIDATGFASKLQQAAVLLGVDLSPPRQVRRPLPGQPRIIEHNE